jgi:DHA2 family multidrug resistance protein
MGRSSVKGDSFAPVPNRGLITISIMLANIMQGVDNTILNVALPHIQGSLSASLDQIAWALTSYIVCAAIMMPLTGWFAGQFGIKYVFLASVIGFTLASALCGAATSLPELVFFRALQGVAGAGLIPLSQATLFQINPPERHGHAMAIFGIGTILGPIMGPALGGWLTYDYSWRWVFYINLPVGVVCTLGILVFVRQTRNLRREPFRFLRVPDAEPGDWRLAIDARSRRVEGLVSFERNLDRGDGRRTGSLSVYRPHGHHRRALFS